MKKLLFLSLLVVLVSVVGCGAQELSSSQPTATPIPAPSSRYLTLELGAYKLTSSEGCEAEVKFIKVWGFMLFDGVTVEVNGVRYDHDEHEALVIPLCGVRTEVGEIPQTDTLQQTVYLKLYPGFEIRRVE